MKAFIDWCKAAPDLSIAQGLSSGQRKMIFPKQTSRGVVNLLKVCRSQPCPPRIVHLSSLAAREPSLSPYAWSKREGELRLQNEAGSLNWVIIRPPAVYGPTDKALLPLFRLGKKGVALQLGPHEAKFSLIHVHDLADVVMKSLEESHIHSTIFEVDDGHAGGYSWESVFQLINPHMKIRMTVPPRLLWLTGRVMNYWLTCLDIRHFSRPVK